VGFNRVKPWERVKSYRFCCIILQVMYVGFNGDKHTYVSFLKERPVHLKKFSLFGSYNRTDFARLSIVVFLSVVHYPSYGIPNFIIIKSSQYWFSLHGFSKGIYQKILVFMCA
jgi:hypothetical protein